MDKIFVKELSGYKFSSIYLHVFSNRIKQNNVNFPINRIYFALFVLADDSTFSI